MNILVADVGGTAAKLLATGESEPRRIASGKQFTPQDLVAGIQKHAAGWDYQAATIGYPGHVEEHGPVEEPGNLGSGWVGFDYEKALGVSVRFINDAAMQALGAHQGGRMLFLGLGTGLGSALVIDWVVVPLELGRLHSRGRSLGDRLGKKGFKRDKSRWIKQTLKFGERLRDAVMADEVVYGGGNAKELPEPLPAKARRGGNDDAFTGGFKLWTEPVEDNSPPARWRVVG